MNKEKIVTMKPGRDLDIKVALEVMGYIWLKHLLQFSAELAVKWLGTLADIEDANGMYTVVTESQFIGLKERENFAESVLAFSTDIAAAEQVVKKMEEASYLYNLENVVEQGETRYYACFYKQGEPIERFVGCTTIPEAIVKAALLAE